MTSVQGTYKYANVLQMSWLLQNPSALNSQEMGLMNTPRNKSISMTSVILNTNLTVTTSYSSVNGKTSTAHSFISPRVSGDLPRRCWVQRRDRPPVRTKCLLVGSP